MMDWKIGMILAIIMFAIAGIITYEIGMNVEHEYAWMGFIYWCVFGGIFVIFGLIPMWYFRFKNPVNR